MDTRREFIKKASLLSGAAGIFSALPASIQKALAIDPTVGSTYLDAEHVVILMQENRSFDHSFGSLQGVRGFNDPRAIRLPDGNPVWAQTNAAGDTYLPFRLNIKDTKATWMGSLPHSWTNQVDARNHGKHDKWLDAKRSGNKAHADLPLTLGFYNREDIPFYYAMADAFTVCDQNFCSSLTGTTSNRLFLWTGTIRETHDDTSHANVRNEEVDYAAEAGWKTFPERLEENGVSWKVYQNEISIASLNGEEDDWLANFTDNPLEWFKQYHVRYSTGYQKFIEKQMPLLPGEIETLQKQVATLISPSKELDDAKKQLNAKQKLLQVLQEDKNKWNRDNYDKLSQQQKNIHQKAFAININDPHYHDLTTLKYEDGTTARELQVPKGDVLHQFRDDVKTGQLPLVSWIVAPSNFSDHPGSPWYGAWYVSEVMDILTQNQEVWKKTVFILCYDENDGYFDHVPPYVVPHPYEPGSGLVSKGIDTRVDFVKMEQELKRKPERDSRESSIGLGYRVPLLIASPWSRGGTVCSEIFDHTSIIQFLENFVSHRSGKTIKEENISTWRRTICGDLSSVFQPYKGEKIKMPDFLNKEHFFESVHRAKFKQAPSDFKKLTQDEIATVRKNPYSLTAMPIQEKGIRPASALPYQLYAEGKLAEDKKTFKVTFEARDKFFGKQSAGSPFNVFANKFVDKSTPDVKVWNYAVAAGDSINDNWSLSNFEGGLYHLTINGPNGFMRQFSGDASDPILDVSCEYHLKNGKPDGHIELQVLNMDAKKPYRVTIKDHSYKTADIIKALAPSGKAVSVIDLTKTHGWYDFSVLVEGAGKFEKRYAGRVETGKSSFTDPAMGSVV